MVYGGKPSMGCKECKRRRIKCDEKRPTCSQCDKSNRQCPGYLSQVDVMFRHQTELVTQRAQKKPKRVDSVNGHSSTKSSASPDEIEVEELPLTVTNARSDFASSEFMKIADWNMDFNQSSDFINIQFCIQHSPSLPIEEQASAILFNHLLYFPHKKHQWSRGWLEFLAPMYYEAREDDAVRLATNATSLIAMSKKPATRYMEPFASRVYGKAMKAVYRDLQDPEKNKSDALLLAITLLAMYECSSPMNNNVEAWSSHVDGAAAIVTSRGAAQLKSERGMALFRTTRAAMITNQIRMKRPIKPLPIDGGWLADVKVYKMESYNFVRNIMHLPSLFHRGRDLLHKTMDEDVFQEMDDLVAEALELEKQLQDWAPLVSADAEHHTVSYVAKVPEDLQNAECWVGPVHEYENLHEAALLNKQRASRLMNGLMIMDLLAAQYPDTYEKKRDYQRAAYILQSNIDEICYTIPYLLKVGSIGSEGAISAEMMDSIGAYHLIWPASIAYACPTISYQQKEWLSGRIDVIGRRYGIAQALVVRDSLAKDIRERIPISA